MNTAVSNARAARHELRATSAPDDERAWATPRAWWPPASITGDHAIRRAAVWFAFLVLAIGVAQLLAGCGGSSRSAARPAVCKLSAQRAIARDLAIRFGTVTYARSVGNNDMPQCAFTARAHGRTIVVKANVDNGPQAYFRLLRTTNEASQIFGTPPPGWHPPQGVSGLGPFASWFPNNDQLMATNDRLLLTVTITWPGGGRDEEVRLARAAIVPYLAHPHGPANTHDYP